MGSEMCIRDRWSLTDVVPCWENAFRLLLPGSGISASVVLEERGVEDLVHYSYSPAPPSDIHYWARSHPALQISI